MSEIKLVRCPKCDKVLPEPPVFTVYHVVVVVLCFEGGDVPGFDESAEKEQEGTWEGSVDDQIHGDLRLRGDYVKDIGELRQMFDNDLLEVLLVDLQVITQSPLAAMVTQDTVLNCKRASNVYYMDRVENTQNYRVAGDYSEEEHMRFRRGYLQQFSPDKIMPRSSYYDHRPVFTTWNVGIVPGQSLDFDRDSFRSYNNGINRHYPADWQGYDNSFGSRISSNMAAQQSSRHSMNLQRPGQGPMTLECPYFSSRATVPSEKEYKSAMWGMLFHHLIDLQNMSSGVLSSQKKPDTDSAASGLGEVLNESGSRPRHHRGSFAATKTEVDSHGLSNSLSDSGDIPREDNYKDTQPTDSPFLKSPFASKSDPVSSKNGEVYVNGQQVPHHVVKKAESLLDLLNQEITGNFLQYPLHYDPKGGFWGVMGRHCLGILPPSIQEFSFRCQRVVLKGTLLST
ncbi:Nucleolar protein 9 [Bienertia sinuspersici]